MNAVGEAQLGERVGDVGLDGCLCKEQLLAGLGVGAAARK
jgi:hypothetical protein